MVVYYENNGAMNVDIFNGLDAFKRYVETNNNYGDSCDHMALRSCELFIESVKDRAELLQIISNLETNGIYRDEDSGVIIKTYFEPVERFTSKERMLELFKEELPGEEDMYTIILYAMLPEAFFGMEEDDIRKEIHSSYEYVMELAEEDI